MRAVIWRTAAVLAIPLSAAACRNRHTVKVAWDTPAVQPDHYRVLVDGREVRSFRPPAVDPSCKCMIAEIEVERGPHAVRVEACDRVSACSSSAEVQTD